MPQGRRKVPFSGKKKKEQYKAKKLTKEAALNQAAAGSTTFLAEKSDDESGDEIVKVNAQPTRGSRENFNRYALQFRRETDAELKKQKEEAYHGLNPISEKELEISADDYFTVELDFPKRPPWNFNMSRQQLEANEHRYFLEYIKKIEKACNWSDLGYLELNLETWRQLWRVTEISDIILFIVDIRFPAAMFPPSFYNYVTKSLKKDMILILNKIDLAPAPLVVAWKNYFIEKYPDLHILMFTSFPGYNIQGCQTDKGGLLKRRRKGRLRMAAEGAQQICEVCKEIVKDQVDLTSWQLKIAEETAAKSEFDDVEIGEVVDTKCDTSYVEHEKYKNGILTIGCVGQPNVGKSSLMNAIMGKKVVSVSRTPGHTKHFQTIFLTPNVRLCDCPGLVFPSKVPKMLQVLMGTFPIAQLRQPYAAIRYIAERLDLPKMLRIQHPDGDEEWSPMDICDAWAKRKGFLTAKAARPDTYRAANHLLRMQLDGKICLCLRPPQYLVSKEKWENHSDIRTVKWIQAKSSEEEVTNDLDIIESSDEEEQLQKSDAVNSVRGERKTNSESSSEEEEANLLNVQNKFAVLLADDN